MARKKKMHINRMKNRDNITDKIINQINSLNKKIKAFKGQDIEEHLEFVKHYITKDLGQFTANDTLSKSKKFYADKNIVWLKKSLASLVMLNNHEYYGTTNKYKKEVTASFEGAKKYVADYLRKKGYSNDFIFEVTNSKDFFVKLFDSYKNNENYGSDQSIEKIALNYEDSGKTDKEKNKILSNIEHGANTLKRIQQENEAFEEFKNSRNKKMR